VRNLVDLTLPSECVSLSGLVLGIFRDPVVVVLFAFLALDGIHAQAQQSVAASPRVTAASDDSNPIMPQGNVHPLATAANDQDTTPGSLEPGRPNRLH